MFTENAFALLEGLSATPTKAFYEQHKNEIVASGDLCSGQGM